MAADVFYSEEEDASQSAHRDERRAEPARVGGRRWEEFTEEEQGEVWEEASNTFQSGNPASEKNASRLTHLFKPEVQRQPVKTHTQEKQAQTGKRLHVYLEETSVTGRAGQQVICTKTKKSLHILPKAKSSLSFDSDKEQSYSSTLVGVLLKPQKDSQSDQNSELEADDMGRKNPRRKYRKNSQGEEKSNPPPGPKGVPVSDQDLTLPQSPKSCVNSTSETNPTPQASPEGGEAKSSCPEHLDASQESNTAVACAVDAGADMEDDLYKVERRTETPESKRRSMKISKSEVKLFTKNIPLKAEQSSSRDKTDFKATSRRDEIKEETKSDLRSYESKKPEEKPKPAPGRITDRINLFENRQVESPKQTSDTSQSADVSPVRMRQKPEFDLSELRSRSANRQNTTRSTSASPSKDKAMTIKERVKSFTETSVTITAAPTQKPSITRMPLKGAQSKSLDILDIQGEPDANEKTVSQMVLKLDGADTATPAAAAGLKNSTPEERPTVMEKANEETQAKGQSDSSSVSPQSKAPTRTGSRSKRRKSKEPMSPLSPDTDLKLDSSVFKLEDTAARDQLKVNVPITDKASSSEKAQECISDKSRSLSLNSENKQDSTALKKEVTSSSVRPKVKGKLDNAFAGPQPTNKVSASDKVLEKAPKTTLLSRNSESKLDFSTVKQEVTSGKKKISDKEENVVATPRLRKSLSMTDETHERASKKTSSFSPTSENKSPSFTVRQKVTSSSRQLKVNDEEDNGTTQSPKRVSSVKVQGRISNETSLLSPNSENILDTSTVKAEAPTSTEQKRVDDKGSDKTHEKASPLSIQSENKPDSSTVKREVTVSSREEKVKNKEDNAPGTNRVSSSDKAHETTSEKASPLSAEHENKPNKSTVKQEVTTLSGQQKVTEKQENASVVTQLTDKVLSPDKPQERTSKTLLSDTEESGLTLKKDVDTPDGKEEGLPQLSVSNVETDTVSIRGQTKAAIDKDPVISPQKEQETAEANSALFTKQTETLPKDGTKMLPSSDSPGVERINEKSGGLREKELSVASNLETELSKEDAKVTHDTKAGLIKQVDEKVTEKGEKSAHTKKSGGEAERIETQVKVSDCRQASSGQEASVARQDERKIPECKAGEQAVADITQTQDNQPESAPQISVNNKGPSEQTEALTAHRENNAFCVQANEAASEPGSDKGPSKGDTIGPGVLTKSTKIPGKEVEPKAAKAEPQPKFVSVEKRANRLDDSHSHGDTDAEKSSSKPVASASAEEGTVKAALISAAHSDNVEKPGLFVAPVNPSADRADRPNVSEISPESTQISGDLIKGDSRDSNSKASTSEEKSIKLIESNVKPDITKPKVNVTAEKILLPPPNDPVANGDVSSLPKLHALKPEAGANKQSLKAQTTLGANKLQILESSLKKRNFLKGKSKDDSCTAQRDAPSSWLDVDFPKHKLKVQEARLTSSGSESNLLDTSGDLDDEEFVEKIKKLCAPFPLPPRKHNHIRPQQPPTMPAIKEDRFEKPFDPEEFTFGLRKKPQFSFESTTSLLGKLQNSETKPSIKPARASFADRSMLLSGLDSHSRLREKTPAKDEQEVKEEKDEIKVKSRLEGSSLLSSLSTSNFRSKRNVTQAQAENTNSENGSSSDSPQPSTPLLQPSTPPLSQPSPPLLQLDPLPLSQPSPLLLKPSPPISQPNPLPLSQLSPPLLQQSPLPLSQPPPPCASATGPVKDHRREETNSTEPVVSDSGPPLPSFNDIKLPDYLEKYLPREVGKAVQSETQKEPVDKEFGVKMPTPPGGKPELGVKPGLTLPDGASRHFSGISPNNKPTLPEPNKPPAQPKRKTINKIRTAKGFHKRPGKMVVFEKAQFEGQVYEIHRDVEDATSLQLSPLISVKVVRGCWVLYEKPGFQGRTVALEEGSLELANVWAEPGPEVEAQNDTPMQIGSIRLAVSDYSIPHIDLFTEPEGRGRVTPYHDDVVETGTFGIPLSTASIQVHSGVWLVFSDPGFQGMLAVLETGGYPFPETWGFPSPFVGSLRPLKMGGFKVENPNEVKAVVYEKPAFEGSSMEIDTDVFSFCDEDEGEHDGSATDPKSVGSLKINGGLWVGYSEPGFEGQQFILEEGEYLDSSEWGGSEILSLRPIVTDFMSPHLKMFTDRDFGKLGLNIDLTVPVINLDETGYGTKTQSLDVISGVWVVFEEPGFCGESYILEKGLYGSPEDWGGTLPTITSAMPVVLENFENTVKFKVQLFTEADFQGSVLTLEDSEGLLPDGFSVASCKVLAGSWIAFEDQDFTGNMYVLDEGNYPDLRAMGSVSANGSILSLQTVGFEFSLPSITLFERCGLKGKRVVLTDGSVNLQLSGGGGRVQSMSVEGGMWVLYEEINYRGAQILLKPGEVPDWRSFINWRKIGSLRPLIQKQVHFHLRNRQTGNLMTVTGDLDEIKLLRIQEMEETNGFEQIWFFQNGHIRCKLLEECCLSPGSSVTIAGCRVGLTPALDEQTHLWSITPAGFITYSTSPNLVLEVKGGHNYDKNQVILNTLDPHKLQQQWAVEVL